MCTFKLLNTILSSLFPLTLLLLTSPLPPHLPSSPLPPLFPLTSLLLLTSPLPSHLPSSPSPPLFPLTSPLPSHLPSSLSPPLFPLISPLPPHPSHFPFSSHPSFPYPVLILSLFTSPQLKAAEAAQAAKSSSGDRASSQVDTGAIDELKRAFELVEVSSPGISDQLLSRIFIHLQHR